MVLCTHVYVYVHTTVYYIVFLYVAPISMISFNPTLIQGAVVGNPLTIECVVTTVSGVSNVTINWSDPARNLIMNYTRITISPTTPTNNVFTSSLQFEYLIERDEGTYTCNVMILETINSSVVEIQTPNSEFFFDMYVKILLQLFKGLCNILNFSNITISF